MKTTVPVPELRLEYATVEELRADWAQNLKKGRAFVPGATGPAALERCTLVVVNPASGEEIALPAESVWVKPDAPGAGVGVAMKDLDERTKVALEELVARDAPPAPSEQAEQAEQAEDDGGDEASRAVPRNVHERVRAMGLRERELLARQGSLPERVALERCFGGNVWEGLLQNPQITAPEVARIARNGGLPRPLVNVVVANAGWLANGEVQRALLSNPRVSGPALDRVLRAMPRSELIRVGSLSTYRAEVRVAAKKLLGNF